MLPFAIPPQSVTSGNTFPFSLCIVVRQARRYRNGIFVKNNTYHLVLQKGKIMTRTGLWTISLHAVGNRSPFTSTLPCFSIRYMVTMFILIRDSFSRESTTMVPKMPLSFTVHLSFPITPCICSRPCVQGTLVSKTPVLFWIAWTSWSGMGRDFDHHGV